MTWQQYLAPTEMPEDQAVTKSVDLSPFPASWRHMPGNPRRVMLEIQPAQPVLEVTPPVRRTFSSRVIWPTNALALPMASDQSPVPVALAVDGQD